MKSSSSTIPLVALRQTLGLFLGQALLARHVLGAAAEQDVGAAAGHVGGDGHVVLAAGLGHDLGFLRVVLRVQHDVPDAALAEQGGEPFGLLDRHGADQRRPARLLLLEDVVDDRVELFLLGPVDEVGLLDAAHHAVRRNRHHVEVVDLVELGRFGLGRARHARELLVLAEVVLEGDGGERLVLALDLHLLLRLDGLVQPVAPAAARHQAARELVDDHDAAVLDHVVHVQPVQRVGAEPLLDVVEQRHVDRVVQAAGVRHQAMAEHLLGLGHAASRSASPSCASRRR